MRATLSRVLGAGLLVACLMLPACAQEQVPVVTREVPTSPAQIQLSFAPIVKRVAPAVVNIQASRTVAAQRQPFLNDPMLDFFFGHGGQRPSQQRDQVENAVGSGVMLRADGVVVTNNHVIEDADQITVVLADRRSFSATVLFRDDHADLAFLKIDAHGEQLPTLPLARSDQLQVGDLVLALGNPFGLGQTVTSGIVSATNRSAEGLERDVSFIQTDAAINPGNSGGALVDLDGRLAGINTAIFSQSGGSVGIGFAIPADLVRIRLQNALSSNQAISRPWLGAKLQSVDVDIADSLGMASPRGVLVGRIWRNGAAAHAGLEAGDVILTIDDTPVDDPAGLGYRMSLKPIGTSARVEIQRKQQRTRLELPRMAAPEQPVPEVTVFEAQQPLGGSTVANMSPGFNERNGLDPFESGVVVLGVRPGSRSAYMNLEPGDLIIAVDGNEVHSVEELKRALPQRGVSFRLAVKSGERLYRFRVSG